MSEVKIVPIDGKPDTFKTEDGKELVTKELNDRLIQQRLAEEKAKWEGKANDAQQKAEQALQALETAKAEMKALESVKAGAEDANKALEDTFAAIVSGMSESAKTLIPEHGTIADKIKFINKNSAVFFAKQDSSVGTPPPVPKAPNTPPPSDQSKQTAIPPLSEIMSDPRGSLARLDSLRKGGAQN